MPTTKHTCETEAKLLAGLCSAEAYTVGEFSERRALWHRAAEKYRAAARLLEEADRLREEARK